MTRLAASTAVTAIRYFAFSPLGVLRRWCQARAPRQGSEAPLCAEAGGSVTHLRPTGFAAGDCAIAEEEENLGGPDSG